MKNKDGSTSNVKLATFQFDDKHVVIPTMVGGKDVSSDEAVKIARKHGLDKYPTFSSKKEAERFAKENHGRISPTGTLK